MIPLTLAEIASIVGGRLNDADPAAVVTGDVEFDSRAVTAGDLFLALPGERVDGHDYTSEAARRGAVASIVTREVSGPAIIVGDGFAALGALAKYVLGQLPDCLVIGVTGSSGKTSTKDLLAQLLGRLGRTVAPPGSYNNELGHPYTVLRATLQTRFLVLENSARGIGHIRYLTEIAPPRIGVVLNVGSAHLGEFGSREAIARAKGELVEALPADGVAVLNADDPLVSAMAGRTAARVVTFGAAASAEIRATDVRLDERGCPSFTLHRAGGRADVRLQLVGAHHVWNALAAAAVALECGLPLADTADALAAARPASRWRMETVQRPDGVLLINDAYNANPESMRAALEALAAVAVVRRRDGGRFLATLGDMAEFGSGAPGEHEAVGGLAARLDVSRLIAVGEQARPILHGAALEGSWTGEGSWVPDADSAIAVLRAELRPGDVVLVKASRAAQLERVVEALADDAAPGVSTDGGGQA